MSDIKKDSALSTFLLEQDQGKVKRDDDGDVNPVQLPQLVKHADKLLISFSTYTESGPTLFFCDVVTKEVVK